MNESVLRINFPQLLGELSKIAQEAFAQCASYQGNPDRNLGKKPAIPISWKGIGRFVDARDGLVYRNEALIWHVRLLLEQKEHLEKEIERAFPDDTKAFQVEVTSRQKLGFILDDIIFNSMSAFDYLSEFVFAAHMPKKRGKILWSSLIKNCHRIKDKELVSVFTLIRPPDFGLIRPFKTVFFQFRPSDYSVLVGVCPSGCLWGRFCGLGAR